MESTSRIKLIIIGLVLAAIVVGYFILAQRFQGNKTATTQNTNLSQRTPLPTSPTNRAALSSPSASPVMLGQGSSSGQSGTNRSNIQTLPRTGVPAGLIAVFGVSAAISGYFLRKFPQ